MTDRVPRSAYPWWVKLALWGLPGRGAVVACGWLSVAAAAGGTTWAVWGGNPRWFSCLLFLASAMAYRMAVRWVDRHGSWEEAG